MRGEVEEVKDRKVLARWGSFGRVSVRTVSRGHAWNKGRNSHPSCSCWGGAPVGRALREGRTG